MNYDEKLQEYKSNHLPKSSKALFKIQPQIADLLHSGYTKQQIFEFVEFLGLNLSRSVVFKWLKENASVTSTVNSTAETPTEPKSKAQDISTPLVADKPEDVITPSPLPKETGPKSQISQVEIAQTSHQARLKQFLGKSQEEQLKEMRDN